MDNYRNTCRVLLQINVRSTIVYNEAITFQNYFDLFYIFFIPVLENDFPISSFSYILHLFCVRVCIYMRACALQVGKGGRAYNVSLREITFFAVFYAGFFHNLTSDCTFSHTPVHRGLTLTWNCAINHCGQ